MEPVRIDVATPSRPYTVLIADGSLDRMSRVLDELRIPERRILVSSPLVWRLHGARLAHGFGDALSTKPILVPDGERFKHLATVSRVYDALVHINADRASIVVTFGGGVLGDMAGFAAATYLRGIPVVHLPTTLLAQVDSAIGGKVGVNHPLGKNLIGAFHQPALVAIDPALLSTLPRREFRAGLYEVIKYGVIASRPLFDRVAGSLKPLFARDHAALIPVVTESTQIKTDVVQQDEREGGLRRILNFGHTAGHALEAVTKYKRLRHGEAVAYGMLVASEIAVRRWTMPENDREALAALIAKMGPLPAVSDVSVADMIEAIGHDKKVVAGKLHFVLPRGIGRCEVVTDVTRDEIASALTRCCAL